MDLDYNCGISCQLSWSTTVGYTVLYCEIFYWNQSLRNHECIGKEYLRLRKVLISYLTVNNSLTSLCTQHEISKPHTCKRVRHFTCYCKIPPSSTVCEATSLTSGFWSLRHIAPNRENASAISLISWGFFFVSDWSINIWEAFDKPIFPSLVFLVFFFLRPHLT